MRNTEPEWAYSVHSIGPLRTALVEPQGETTPTELIVLCHGYGAPGDDLVGIAEYLIEALGKHQRAPVLAFPKHLSTWRILECQEVELGGRSTWRDSCS